MNKFKKSNFLKTLGLVGACLQLAGVAAHAEIPTGYFKGDGYRALVKTVRQGKSMATYGVLFQKFNGNDESASIYRIEELEDGSQTWFQLIQTTDYLVGTSANGLPRFLGQTLDGGDELKLTAKTKCESGDIRMKKKSDRYSWNEFPKTRMRLDAPGWFTEDLEIAPGYLSGNLEKGKVNNINGRLNLTELFPGFGVLRAQDFDPESGTGKIVNPEIKAVVIPVYSDGLIFNTQTFRVLKFDLAAMEYCNSYSSQLKQD